MITIFNTHKNTTPLTPEQRTELIRCIYLYFNTKDRSWLKSVDYDNIEYMWKEDIKGSAVMAIRQFVGNSIILQSNALNNKIRVQCITSAAIHELKHIYQNYITWWWFSRQPAKLWMGYWWPGKHMWMAYNINALLWLSKDIIKHKKELIFTSTFSVFI